MTQYPKVLIIIVTWNKKKYILDLLDSLRKLHYAEEMIDVVVVDNASTDETVQVIRRDFPGVKLIVNSENLGGTGGFNTGLSYAFEQPDGRYDYLWLLDNDVLVHPDALAELTAILEREPDVAVAGSTMMQLDRPWRINEMGSSVDLERGRLLHNQHLEDVEELQEKTVQQMQQQKIDLSELLQLDKASFDVEYVAAASLVIRASVASRAGLWEDYFIHYDDVEWCLRISDLGYRIVVSARSLIWHVSAEYKVPTWVLYYDNRNVLYMLEKHSGKKFVRNTIKFILKKSIYYSLLGKQDLAWLHLEALADFKARRCGKKEIMLDKCYHPLNWVAELLQKQEIRRILIPWTIDFEILPDLQKTVVTLKEKRPELEFEYLLPPLGSAKNFRYNYPDGHYWILPSNRVVRFIKYWRMKNKYDLVFQSDYQPILPLNLVAKKVLFVNYEGVSIRRRITWMKIYLLLKPIVKVGKLLFSK
jgi:GT2 family glycosyltransferase